MGLVVRGQLWLGIAHTFLHTFYLNPESICLNNLCPVPMLERVRVNECYQSKSRDKTKPK